MSDMPSWGGASESTCEQVTEATHAGKLALLDLVIRLW